MLLSRPLGKIESNGEGDRTPRQIPEKLKIWARSVQNSGKLTQHATTPLVVKTTPKFMIF